MKAAVFHGPHQPLTIENVDIDKPIGREVLVRTVASGVCHSDLHFVDGFYPFPTPAILGHEAAGIVEAVGLQVSEFKPGDHVIACLSVFCGHCDYCLTGKTHLCQTRPVRAKTDPPKLSWKGQPVNQFANLSAYAEQMLVHENALVKIDDSMPLDRAALIGCGVTTGVGAVLNTARIEAGSTVAVFGAGRRGPGRGAGSAHRGRPHDHRGGHRRVQAHHRQGARRHARGQRQGRRSGQADPGPDQRRGGLLLRVHRSQARGRAVLRLHPARAAPPPSWA